MSAETATAAASQQEEEGEPQQQPPQQQPPQPAAAAAAAANHSPPPPPPPAKRKKKLPEQQQQPQQPQQPQQQEQPAAANIAAAPPEDTWLADYEYGVLQQLFNAWRGLRPAGYHQLALRRAYALEGGCGGCSPLCCGEGCRPAYPHDGGARQAGAAQELGREQWWLVLRRR